VVSRPAASAHEVPEQQWINRALFVTVPDNPVNDNCRAEREINAFGQRRCGNHRNKIAQPRLVLDALPYFAWETSVVICNARS
jgi:hypothetical protein